MIQLVVDRHALLENVLCTRGAASPKQIQEVLATINLIALLVDMRPVSKGGVTVRAVQAAVMIGLALQAE